MQTQDCGVCENVHPQNKQLLTSIIVITTQLRSNDEALLPVGAGECVSSQQTVTIEGLNRRLPAIACLC